MFKISLEVNEEFFVTYPDFGSFVALSVSFSKVINSTLLPPLMHIWLHAANFLFLRAALSLLNPLPTTTVSLLQNNLSL